MSREKILAEYGVKRLSPRIKNLTRKVLEGEVKDYYAYLSGDSWGFHVLEGDSILEAEYGFSGEDSALQSAKDFIDERETNKVMEREEIQGLTEEELPLHVNRSWTFDESRDYYKTRLKGVANVNTA